MNTDAPPQAHPTPTVIYTAACWAVIACNDNSRRLVVLISNNIILTAGYRTKEAPLIDDECSNCLLCISTPGIILKVMYITLLAIIRSYRDTVACYEKLCAPYICVYIQTIPITWVSLQHL